ncbi:hypothetical protein IW262DRAFT_787660 [Armillaria fumosa]|nr:hypothetical protein IW262DRAFT_787660 [Armillaria fumosa]
MDAGLSAGVLIQARSQDSCHCWKVPRGHEHHGEKGAVPADRPRSFAAGEMLSSRMRVPLTLAGERFKKMLSALHSHLQPKSIAS